MLCELTCDLSHNLVYSVTLTVVTFVCHEYAWVDVVAKAGLVYNWQFFDGYAPIRWNKRGQTLGALAVEYLHDDFVLAVCPICLREQ